VCDYKAALAAATPDFATAKKIYSAGKNSRKSDGSIRTFKGMALTMSASDEPFADSYSKYFKNSGHIEDITLKALDGVAPFTTPLARREIAGKSIEANLIVSGRWP